MSGIKLDIDEEGKVDVHNETVKLECFGGCFCSDLEIRMDPQRGERAGYWCSYSNKSVADHYYHEGKCPMGKWQKALPCGSQNLTEKERRKWYAESLDDPDPEFDSEDSV